MGIRSLSLQRAQAGHNPQANQPFFRTRDAKNSTKFFSPKTAVNEPNDKYEQEANSVARKVSKAINNPVPPSVQRKCQHCEQEEKVQRKNIEDETIQKRSADEEEGLVQTKSDIATPEKEIQKMGMPAEEEMVTQRKENPLEEETVQRKTKDNGAAVPYLDHQLERNAGNGRPLPEQTRLQMERSIGADFSQVRIHDDSEAAQMSKDLHAHAFTHGSDIYFNHGKYDTASDSGRELLAHELTHVVQQNGAIGRKQIQRQVVFGSGYAGYPTPGAEVAKAKDKKWNPTSIDFSTNAGRSGGGSGAKDLPELIDLVSKQGKGAIKKLGIIGHSNAKAMGLSGDVHSPGVPLRGIINEGTLKTNKAKIDAIKDRFAPGAFITLYSCNSGGISDGLADVMSEAFGVCVKGFRNNVVWCITFNESPLSITSRGNVFYENPNDPLAGTEANLRCSSFHPKVDDLTPDVNSCKGVPNPTQKNCLSPNEIPVLGASSEFQFASLPSQGPLGSLPNTGAGLQQFQSKPGLANDSAVDNQTASALVMPSISPENVAVISQIEGLQPRDGLTFETLSLRPNVRRLQQLLTLHGSFTKTDGMFGPKTRFALNIFQASRDLDTTDHVDRGTADLLEGRSNGICPFGKIEVTA
ncbi:MAG TPA: DUF4157 domain-containing protein [Chryseolinea sp.]|nr:DUF4157 domain-containing protein [Chryseolinea sp.]